MKRSVVALAGPSGDLGGRILKALIRRGAEVRALVREDASDGDVAPITALGGAVVRVRPTDVASMTPALRGAACVVSALNGLRDTIVDRQTFLLTAAEEAGVPRFIPSDFASDFTKIPPGDNRNFDFRRELMARADRSKVQITSILNGAFLDMLGAEMPILQPRIRCVLCWGSADQPLDFTAKDDVADYTAAAALDAQTPRWLRIAGDVVTAREIAQLATEVSGDRWRTLRVGGIGALGLVIRIAKRVAPQPDEVFPPWQGMQYMRDMFSGRGKLEPVDSARYPDVRFTSVRERLAALSLGPSRR